MQLFKANRQWQTRPPDERFRDLDSLYAATREYTDSARVSAVLYSSMRVEAQEKEMALVGKSNQPAQFTHWAFGQLSARVGAPADYLRSLPPTLAAQNLNYGLANRPPEGTAQLLFHTNGGLLLRAFTSDKYARIWNYEVAERLLTLRDRGWEPAKPKP